MVEAATGGAAAHAATGNLLAATGNTLPARWLRERISQQVPAFGRTEYTCKADQFWLLL
jgi:hypothetical protein